MGCDIHYFAERRTKEGWERLDVVFDFGGDRNYSLFCVLAGVRCLGELRQIVPIAPMRGLPLDLSPGAVRLILEDLEPFYDDGHGGSDFVTFLQDDITHHSHSWVLLSELMEYRYDQCERCVAVGEVIHQHAIPALSRFGSPNDIRLVFWFDS